ncbi:unnamed protein product [Urochloa humidicola]
MEPASAAAAGTVVLPDWTALPQEILLSLMGELGVADLVRSGVVCASWHGAYAAFRRLRLPSPRQHPCLLYSCAAFGAAAALHCPATGATLRIPTPEGLPPLAALSPIGSADGWLVASDEASNLHLLNPLTGARAPAPLPPITALRGVEPGTCLDEDGNRAYRVREEAGDPSSGLVPIPVGEARDCLYSQAFLSAAPSAGRACVVLLLHSPPDELLFARPGDERWTWIGPPGERTGLRRAGSFFRGAAYNEKDGSFYVVRSDDSIDALDLSGASPVVAKRIMPNKLGHGNRPFRYLIHAPWGELLQVLRFRKEHGSATYVELDPDDDYSNDPELEIRTTELQLYQVDSNGQRLVRLDGVPDHALFLGYNGSLCLPVSDYPGLKANCAYITEDSSEFMNYCKPNKREIGLWDIKSQRLQALGDTMPRELLWLNWPPPIWITPSLL